MLDLTQIEALPTASAPELKARDLCAGNLSIAFNEENPTNTSTGTVGGRFLNYTVPAGSSIVIPQGLFFRPC